MLQQAWHAHLQDGPSARMSSSDILPCPVALSLSGTSKEQ